MGQKLQQMEHRYPPPGEKFTVKLPVAPTLEKVNLHHVQGLGCSSRIRRLRANYFKNRPTICLHHARTYTKVYRETECQPMVIRRGKAFKKFCEEKPIVIQDDELIVGNPGCRPRFVNVCPEFSWHWVEEELDTLSTRAQDPYLISEEQKKELKEEIFPYWKGKSVYELCQGLKLPETKRLTIGSNIICSDVKQVSGLGHFVPGYGNKVFPRGFKGIEETARRTMSRLSYKNPEDVEKIEFLQAVIMSCQGMKILGERHAAEARRLAEKEESPEKKKELLEIAEVCNWVPYNPPRTFHEAVQMAWFVQVGCYMEQSGPGMGLGRFDQYMYPYYERDIKEGRLTKERAQELIECLWIKNAEIIWINDLLDAKYFAGYQLFLNISVGGRKRNGMDATNELSYMCMDATKDVRLHSPSLSVLVHQNSPDKFLMKAAELTRIGIGYPQWHNDEVGVSMMLSCGASLEDAYDWDVMGCSEPQIQGRMWKYSDAGEMNMGAWMEFALNDGYWRTDWRKDGNKERWGVATGDPRKFKSYEEVADAFKKQLVYFTEHQMISNQVTERAHATRNPYPYASCLLEGCVEKGVDFTRGGAQYNVGPSPSYIGLADVANSLAAVKKFVFDEKTLNMDELMNALDNNFEGREDLRLMLLNRGPKYGWDNDYVDEIARWVADLCSEESHKYHSIRGCQCKDDMFPVSANTPLGLVVGALPSGRKAGMPLADGVSPQQETDKSPTEVIKSVTKFDHKRHENGLLVNMKFTPTLLKGERGLRNFISLVRTFFDRGGWHIQFNVVAANTLKDAQRYPEKYPALMVRVAGYSAYFTDLSQGIQNDIISRMEHTRW